MITNAVKKAIGSPVDAPAIQKTEKSKETVRQKGLFGLFEMKRLSPELPVAKSPSHAHCP
jgi:hypothetical protein